MSRNARAFVMMSTIVGLVLSSLVDTNECDAILTKEVVREMNTQGMRGRKKMKNGERRGNKKCVCMMQRRRDGERESPQTSPGSMTHTDPRRGEEGRKEEE